MPMLQVTPRATVILTLARREAELLDQSAASGHILVALIWEGEGLAAHALADAGLPKGADEDVRHRLAAASESERGLPAFDLQRLAGSVASDLGHNYVGTEHQLLALARDSSLGETVLPSDARQRANTWLHARLVRPEGT